MNLWDLYSVFVILWWCICEVCMLYLWVFYDVFVQFVWCICAICMMYLWDFYNVFVRFVQDIFGYNLNAGLYICTTRDQSHVKYAAGAYILVYIYTGAYILGLLLLDIHTLCPPIYLHSLSAGQKHFWPTVFGNGIWKTSSQASSELSVFLGDALLL